MSALTDRAYRARAEQALAPGEPLLFLETVARTALPSSLDLQRAATSDTSAHPWRRRWLLGFDPFTGGFDVNMSRQDLVLHGSSGHGGPGTVGHTLWQLLDDPAGPRPAGLPPRPARGMLLAVTPSRLLLLATPDPLTDGPLRVVHEVPRALVASARRSRRPFAGRGVVEVGFTDGSMKALQLGLWLAGPARRLVRLLAG